MNYLQERKNEDCLLRISTLHLTQLSFLGDTQNQHVEIVTDSVPI